MSRSLVARGGEADDGGFVEGLLGFPFQGEDGGTSFERCEDHEKVQEKKVILDTKKSVMGTQGRAERVRPCG